MKFGLDDKVIEDIQKVFQDNWKVDAVVLFGSRAKGNYREGSDIDLAVKGRDLSFDDILSLSSKLDDLNLPYEIDLINYSTIKDEDVIEHIDRVGIVFYERWKETEIGNIPAEWTLKTINDIKSNEKKAIISGPFGSNISSQYFVSSGVPVIRGNNLSLDIAKKFIDKNFVFLTEEKSNELGTWATRDDIIFTAAGTIGQVGLLTGEEKYSNYIISNKQLRIRLNKDIVTPLFAYYWFASPYITDTIVKNDTGSTIPLINLTVLKSLPIPVPSVKEQEKIVDVLSSLDKKVDLLQRQNKTLEQLAETLFRQWFVEQASEDWEAGTLEDEFDFIMGQSPEGITLNENEIGTVFYQGRSDFGFRFPEPRIYTTSSTRLAKKFDTLVSVRAPVGDMNMAIEECCLGRGVAAFRYKHDPSFYTYTYYKMRSLMSQIKQFEDNGSVFGSIGKDDFKKLENDIPPKDLIERFQKEVEPLDDKIYLNTTQIASLTKLRDTLLPKLMRGDVRVRL